MVSLLDLAEITEEGVLFQSPIDGKQMMLRPEDSIAIQNRIGSDIMMALDDVVSSRSTDQARFEEVQINFVPVFFIFFKAPIRKKKKKKDAYLYTLDSERN